MSVTQPRPPPSPGSPIQLFPKATSSCSHCQPFTAPPAALPTIPGLSHPDVPHTIPPQLFPLPPQGHHPSSCCHHAPNQLFSLPPSSPIQMCPVFHSQPSPHPRLSPYHPMSPHRPRAIFKLPFRSLLLRFHPELFPTPRLSVLLPPSGDGRTWGGPQEVPVPSGPCPGALPHSPFPPRSCCPSSLLPSLSFPFLPTRTKPFGFQSPAEEEEQSEGFWGVEGISPLGKTPSTLQHYCISLPHLGNPSFPPHASVSPKHHDQGTPPKLNHQLNPPQTSCSHGSWHRCHRPPRLGCPLAEQLWPGRHRPPQRL